MNNSYQGSTSQYHSANYRGQQQGQDNYLRADATRPSNAGQFGGQFSGGSGMSMGMGVQSNVGSSYGQSVGAQSTHTSRYRGQQQGHDNYLRADSRRPSNSSNAFVSNSSVEFGSGFGSRVNQSTFRGSSIGQSVSPQSFHTANYRGDQQGHDQYLRSDKNTHTLGQSTQSFSQSTSFASVPNYGGTSVSNQSPTYSQFQSQSQRSYQTTGYRGNQQGHDNYLRSDSQQSTKFR